MLTKMKLAIVMCGSLICGVASAQGMGNGPSKPGRILKYDLNHDGTVDAQEKATRKADMKSKRAAKKQQALATFDANKDGKLDQTERATLKDTRATELFKKLDVDSNGSISLVEFKQAKSRFAKRHPRAGRGMKRAAIGR